ncbi:helix-turn-helix transcriptional regulator [Schinkia azotoformans]|uniref:helix-turn-helix domain-containing protein n=1 Tax=Schinkia azotoformans TaxID=1454 RepID=UPI002E1C4BA2|nr:helix-turn-helix transcriptional regulator [Schinkia azotoformans]
MITFGERIKYVRKSNKLNQVEFAKIIGVSQGTLSELEQDKYKPSIDTIISINKEFNVNLDWLLIDPMHQGTPKDTYILNIEGKEKELLSLFKKLSSQDQDEIVEIIELKLKKYKK